MRVGGWKVTFLILLLLLVISILVAVSIGSENLFLPHILRAIISGIPGMSWAAGEFTWSGPLGSERHFDTLPVGYRTIVLRIRLPVVIMALFAGAGLSVSGSSLQGLFKNPLVDPFIIGISAGGAFGYVIAVMITEGASLWVSQITRILLSFIFSVGTVFLAYLLSRTGSRVPLTHLLLAGIALSASLTAATQMLVYLTIENPTPIIFSLMGNCSLSRWWEISIVAPVVILGTALLSLFGRDLNAFSSGEVTAKHLGVDTERSKTAILIVASLMAAITVPFCGMIGFVGLMVPHIMRRFIGPDQRYLIPASALLGGSFLIICDLVARTLLDVTIPLGIITGLLGGAFFIYLLRARKVRG
ncbi:MAG: iron ABC transporter permease [Thermoplasmatota archaeon]